MVLCSRDLWLGATCAFTFAAFAPETAEACGCFAPPDPSVPIVQAGERIVFSAKDGTVTAHIQIQYQGPAEDFGWLLPLPSVPTMRLGTEELFDQLIQTTQPKYRLSRVIGEQCEFQSRGGVGAPNASFDGDASKNEDQGPVVLQASVGPYDYAVLKADDRQEMFDWLTNNHYFVPEGTTDVVGPYIHRGAYFLALKLKKGSDTGDLQPVVVEYPSDLPMIPIVLTSVGARADMGVQVWVLGEHRGIPRNYRHTILNEEHIDWLNAGQNYDDVIIKAVDEAEGHHSFVTEYAGTTDIMKNLLDYPGRFGDQASLAVVSDPVAFVGELQRRGFPWSSPVVAALADAFPMPAAVERAGVSRDEFYTNLAYYLGAYRQQHPEQFADASSHFDPAALAAVLFERVVAPTLEAGRLFRGHPKMTRLYTTLSPEEMTEDPVFSFNPDLPDVSNVHEATLTYLCSFYQDGPSDTPALLRLPGDGREFYLKRLSDWAAHVSAPVPYSASIEILREEGAPEVEVDNGPLLSASDAAGCGCTAAGRPGHGQGLEGGALAALALALLLVRRPAARRPAGCPTE